MSVNVNKKSEFIRQIVTICLGLLIVVSRVIYPTNVEITKTTVIIETIVELLICIGVIFLNRVKLKEIFSKKINYGKLILSTLKIAGLILLGQVFFSIIISILFGLLSINIDELYDPAAIVGEQFSIIFPIGVMFTQCITAPITEEIVFRMTCKDLFKNKYLFIIISSLLFGFIHTANFFNISILNYAIVGVIFSILYIRNKDDLRVLISGHMFFNIALTVLSLL